MKHILDPEFCYVPADKTDIRRTFERIRAERNAELMRRAWKAVQDVFDVGAHCYDCELCKRSGGCADEPATRDCALMYQTDAEPDECPGVDLDDIASEMGGDREDREEYEDSLRDWRDFDARR